METIGRTPLRLIPELEELISSDRFASGESFPAESGLEREVPRAQDHKGYEEAVGRKTREFSLNEDILASVKRSRTMRGIIKQLNKKYVAFDRFERGGVEANDDTLREDGRVKSGPFRGRRVLFVVRAKPETGSRFVRAGNIEIETTGCPLCDFIFIKKPFGKVVPPARTIHDLVHETIHAFHRVCLGSRRKSCRAHKPRSTPKTGADGVRPWSQLARFDIEEEAKTRRLTRKILAEIAQKLEEEGKAKLAKEIEKAAADIRSSIPDVERSFFPSKLRATYLETFVLRHLIREQLKFEGFLDAPHKIRASNRLVDRIKLRRPLEVFLKTEFPSDVLKDPKNKIAVGSIGRYFDLRLIRRVMDARWREADADDKEKTLQAHAKAFFPPQPSPVRYSPPGSNPASRFFR